jgi:hypothetical protein
MIESPPASVRTAVVVGAVIAVVTQGALGRVKEMAVKAGAVGKFLARRLALARVGQKAFGVITLCAIGTPLRLVQRSADNTPHHLNHSGHTCVFCRIVAVQVYLWYISLISRVPWSTSSPPRCRPSSAADTIDEINQENFTI